MNIHLTAELERMVQSKVRSGRYNSATEVVREALRMMERKDEIGALQRPRYAGSQTQGGMSVQKRRRANEGGWRTGAFRSRSINACL